MRERISEFASETSRRTVLSVAAALLLLAVVVPSVVFAAPQVVGADQSYIVMSDSMTPTISAGDAVVARDVSASAVEAGDVIVFEETGRVQAASSGNVDAITHRVVEVVRQDGGLYFRTKGDANENPDPGLVPADAVVGEVWFTIPYLGHVLLFAGSQWGFVALVVIPLGLLVVTELWEMATAARGEETASGLAGGEEGRR